MRWSLHHARSDYCYLEFGGSACMIKLAALSGRLSERGILSIVRVLDTQSVVRCGRES